MLSPGKYDDIASDVARRTKAKAALIIVVGGEKGHGCSAAMRDFDADSLQRLPAMLRAFADDIESQIAADIADLQAGRHRAARRQTA